VPLARIADAVVPATLAPAWAAARRAPVTRLDDFGPWADELWEELRPQLGTCAVRDARFLRWRFCESPFDYTLYGLERGGRTAGFVVLSIRPWRGGATADLLELMAPPGDRAGASALIATALLEARRRGAVAVRAIVSPRHPHRGSFLRAGFLPVPGRLKAGYSFGVCVLDPARVRPDSVLQPEDWYISGADLDYI
jgi:hypothetical protein